MKLIHGDCLAKLRDLPSGTIDCCVTDPPYGLKFMAKAWDYDVPSVDVWREVFRVLKPGGHLLSFGGTRTYHRMVQPIEDAGFEVRDMIQWLYGSGFPKSHDVSKGIDKAAGVEREVVGPNKFAHLNGKENVNCYGTASRPDATTASTDDAKRWQGYGTALKPANEPIVLARKPLEKGLTVAQNVLKYSTGALNIDATRIEATRPAASFTLPDIRGNAFNSDNSNKEHIVHTQAANLGRWPANVLFDEAAAAALDEQVGTNVSKFFYQAKASKRERNAGLEGMPDVRSGTERMNNSDGRKLEIGESDRLTMTKNSHPTVKPIKLMEYLIKLVCPPGGICLDPFMGSGSTLVAAAHLGVQGIGIEQDEAYITIARRRIEHALAEALKSEPEASA